MHSPKNEIGCRRPIAVKTPSNGIEMPSCQCHSIVGNTVGKWMRKLTLIKTVQDRGRWAVWDGARVVDAKDDTSLSFYDYHLIEAHLEILRRRPNFH